ncbi:DoxX family protein [Haloechinothrix sp. LS1_15]|uniref:DoxX family protein n=1 Tax=Haloechinothrix sp. LS1_15 TaxID=2652248 RepID=UPI002945A1CF|nr:DoxX family protein [Haloechinothrix sp. LS1_15]MDV6012527.1 DoxX family protein [Haloechinothrix sp. LS1_15]
MMRTVLWTLQIALAVLFTGAGVMKLVQSHAEYAADVAWAEHFTPVTLNLLGAAEVLGAIGLIVPAATRILPILTPIAASALAAIMAGAVIIHIGLGTLAEIPASAVVLLGCAFVALTRFGPYAVPARAPSPGRGAPEVTSAD